jgi:TolB protein
MSPLPEALVRYRTDLEEAIGREQAARLRRGRRRQRLLAVASGILVIGLLVTPALGLGDRLLDLIQSPPGRPDVRHPVWSPDGRKLAFVGLRASTTGVYVVNADGGGQRRLARQARLPAWSPDGRKIAFESGRNGTTGVYAVNADGGGERRLARHGWLPAWSPDGRKIAFFSGNGKIYVMNADGSEHLALTKPQPGRMRSLAWSPDGRKLAYLNACHPGCLNLYVVRSDGSGLRNLTSKLAAGGHFGDPGPASDPAWSPDGQKLAFVRHGVYVVNADGSGLRNLTPKPVGAYADHAWSPDGRKLAFVGARDGNSEVYIMNADGSGRRALTRNSAYDADPAWSPDGRKIAFVSNRDGNYAIYVMNADGSGQRKLAQHSQ